MYRLRNRSTIRLPCWTFGRVALVESHSGRRGSLRATTPAHTRTAAGALGRGSPTAAEVSPPEGDRPSKVPRQLWLRHAAARHDRHAYAYGRRPPRARGPAGGRGRTVSGARERRGPRAEARRREGRMRARATTPRRCIRRWTRGTGCGARRHSRSGRSSSAAPVTRPANVGDGAAPPARARRRGCRRVAPAAGDAERLSAHRRGDRVGGARAAARHGFSARRNHKGHRVRRRSASTSARVLPLARCRAGGTLPSCPSQRGSPPRDCHAPRRLGGDDLGTGGE